MQLKRTRIDAGVEKRIVLGMIVSKSYLKETYNLINFSYFRNDYLKRVAQWTVDYYEHYEEAPEKEIQTIFNREKEGLKEEEAELISKMLGDMSERYEAERSLNVPYLVDQTVEYYKKRELEITIGNMKVLVDRNDFEGAEEQLRNYTKVQRAISGWVNPFDEETFVEVFDHNEEEVFFQFPGKLGKFLGPFDRGWLVGISAPFKRGKTWFAQEFGIAGMLSRKKVAFISLEMGRKKMVQRIYKRLTAAGGSESQAFVYPVFDCLHNQKDECDLPERTNRHPLFVNGERPEFSPENPYRVCTYCRGRTDAPYNEYFLASWHEILERPPFTARGVGSKIASFRDYYGPFFRLLCYPRFSANLSNIRRDLDILEKTDSFTPDICIVDYADILKPEDTGLTGIEKEDRTWIALSQLAGERHCLVITPTQLTKEALYVRDLNQSHTARWVGKLGHVDVMIGLNQLIKEKRRGVLRINKLVHRHEDFSEEEMVTILQLLNLGQANLDSEFGSINIEREGGETR